MQFWDENYDKDKGYQSKMRFYQWRFTKPELQRELEINGFKTLKVEPLDKWHGLYRTLEFDYHLKTSSRFGSFIHSALYRLVPGDYVSHMLLGVAQKIE